MKLTFYLFNETATSFDDCLKPAREGDPVQLEEADTERDLPYEAKAYWVTLPPKPPKWLGFLSSCFAVNEIENSSHGFILLLKSSERYFAVTFGVGFLHLSRARIERNFGLKVCANTIDSKKVQTMDSRNIDVVTRQQRTHLSEGSSFLDFGIEFDKEWIRFLSGCPMDQAIAKSLSGSDSLRVSTDCNLDQLAGKCDQLVSLFESTAYRTNFGFLDHFQPIKNDDLIRPILENILKAKIQSRETLRLSLALPEVVDYQRLSNFKIYCGHRKDSFEELAISNVYAYLDAHGDIDDVLGDVKIIGLDEADEACTKAFPLVDYIVAEVEHDGKTYSISAGQWFLVGGDYAAEIRAKAREIPDLTTALDLPGMLLGEREGPYNARVHAAKGWLLLDKDVIHLEERYQKVEACDLLTPNNEFICVKKCSRSSTLSHLFAQGSVSADLLKFHPTYSTQIADAIGQGGRDFTTPNPTFVFAIATDKPGSLADSLFLFSAINLVKNCNFIIRAGYQVGLAKIDQG